MKLLHGTAAVLALLAPAFAQPAEPAAAPKAAAAAGAALDAAKSTAILTQLKAARIIPDVVDEFKPTAELNVEYATLKAPITMGQQLASPADAGKPPVVSFNGTDAKKSYTLVMTDPGVLDLTNLRGAGQDAWQWLHWIVANIPGDGKAPAAGLEVMPYGPPAPPAGNHRYTFLLFEQAQAAIKPAAPDSRGAYSARKFATANGLTPVGGTYFLAQPAAK